MAAADQFDQALALDGDDAGDGVFASLGILDLQAGQRAVLTIDQADTGAEFFVFVVGVVPEAVGSDDQILTVFRQQVAIVAAVDVVAFEGDSAGEREMDVGFLAADEIAADAPHAGEMRVFGGTADEPDVRAIGTVRGLDGVAGDGSFSNGAALRTIDVDFGGGDIGDFGLVEAAEVVVFDVVASDLQVADFASFDTDASESIVADVAADDVGLMQIDLVEPDADAGVVIDVAVADQDVAAASREMDGVADLANENAGQCRLHDAIEADAVGFGVLPFNFELAESGQAFGLPDFGLEAVGIGGAFVMAEEFEEGPCPVHDELSGAAGPVDGKTPGPGEVEGDGTGDAIFAARELEKAIAAVVQSVLDGGGIVGQTIAHGSEVSDVRHAWGPCDRRRRWVVAAEESGLGKISE